ncbi:MAG: HEAT repeat domain-containing protein, partial [Acidobacteriota bacterium]|nr:HEAT repeat domain-containing protein [Acidobacteriota bacterium]
IQFDNLDTLPGVVDIGRGSPVGVAFYRHDVYPRRYRGAYFMGDWSRGRIRVLFPERYGATWGGELHDFVLGEPLNVTDLDIGPDGHLYFATGGRQTSGGLYRVTYDRTSYGFESPDGDPSVGLAVAQAMPRSAWGRTALENLRDRAAEAWQPGLRGVIGNADLPSEWRQSALELLWLDRPRPRLDMLAGLLADPDPGLWAAAVTLLSTFDLRTGLERLQPAFEDSDPLVRRRAAESLVRMGVTPFLSHALNTELHDLLAGLLDDPDRFVRYAAREALVLFDPDLWLHHVEATLDAPGHGTFEGILALVLRPDDEASWERALRALQRIRLETVRPEAMGDYLRTLELTLIRDPSRDGRADSLASLGEALLAIYPTGTVQLDRKLERLLAYFSPPGAIDALLDELEEAAAQERQIAIAYSLRAIGDGWRRGQHRRMVDWFDRAWQMRGAASMAGYIEVIFRDVLAQLPARRRARAEARRGAIEEERARRVAKLLDASNEEVAKATQGPGLTQMSFEELAEYLEYDVMAYERYDPTRGAVVFQQARCADCHVFGDLGRGGGPDLSTVVSRFRRSEILESIMYPSKVISDQYSAVDVETRGGDFHSGMIVGDDDDSLTLITANGERVELAASNIQSRRESQISLMPEGLLDAMSLSDLMSLIRFLEAGSNL